VRDLASGAEGRFRGVTVFAPPPAPDEGPASGGPASEEPAPQGLTQREDGDFVWQGVSRPAGRTLRLLPGARPGTADVRFADGRAFHPLDLSAGRFTATHPCAADLYEGEFTVFDADRWRMVWRVRGPVKDLVLTTDYVRSTDHARTDHVRAAHLRDHLRAGGGA
jgi:hypothetical protein